MRIEFPSDYAPWEYDSNDMKNEINQQIFLKLGHWNFDIKDWGTFMLVHADYEDLSEHNEKGEK